MPEPTVTLLVPTWNEVNGMRAIMPDPIMPGCIIPPPIIGI